MLENATVIVFIQVYRKPEDSIASNRKKAHATVASVSLSDYMLLWPEGLHMHTDHQNIILIINSLGMSSYVSKGELQKNRY